MTDPRGFCPQPPHWQLDWDALDGEYPWVAALRGCEQDPEWHAEGDVWIHTRMVLDALAQIAAWREQWFREFARDRACFAAPRSFLSGAHRFEYFRSATRPPDAPVAPEAEFEAIVMSGLPGSGKDTWIAAHASGLPVVSLDALRAEMKVQPEDSQRGVVDAARARARELLRGKTSFVWNATNLSDDVRGQVIDLCAGYGARIRVVCVETSPDEWTRRNQTRRARVPETALARMLRRWQVPDGTEAHSVEHVVT